MAAASPFAFESDRIIRRLRKANEMLHNDVKAAHYVIDALEADKNTLLGLSDRENAAAWRKRQPISTGEAAAILVMSDLHIGEVVRKEAVLGLNEFNHEIAERRIQETFRRWMILLDKERSLAKIDEGVVFLGGDLIGGKIHSDQAEVNDLGIASSVEKAEEWLERGLRTIQRDSGLKKITVVCLSGNHDRCTHKVQHSSFYENSNASIVYAHLRKRFTGDKKTNFILGAGEYEDVSIFKWRFRFTHGHRIRFSGGVGGLSIPWNKHVAKLNKAKRADFTIGGHLHTWTYSSEGEFLVNGSIIGTTAYSLPFGHQPPCQAFLTVDKERCVTAASKVFCE
jgi:predicted phosphodiesterase